MTHRLPPIRLGSPGEEIGRQDLHAVVQRFKNLHQLRLQRAQNFLFPRQREFLNLLPLAFHVNHPLLPGFVTLDTPAGIPDYTPNKQALEAAQQFSKGFTHHRRALPGYPIQAIFLMGSVGSIAFSKQSDMDVWLCHDPALAPQEIDALQQKARELEKWAATRQLEVHFFLIDSQLFRQGKNAPMSAESSGETQHYLLLEEFYRTAIYIAGQFPAWWVVPPQEECRYSDYVEHLVKNRFVAEQDMIDFGGLEVVPAEEFVGATLWHLYKSLSSPHKSLLKLFLMESYASEYPQPQWLCQILKNSVYDGDLDVDTLDPYLLIYRKVDSYLQSRGSQRRLSLARESFYLKILGSTDKTLNPQWRAQREAYLQQIAAQWHWPSNLLHNLKQQKYWNIGKATQAHAVIRDQLLRCLRTTLKFAGRYASDNLRKNTDLKLISRKLHSFLKLRPGKIEIITTRGTIHSKEDTLTLHETVRDDQPSRWGLYGGFIPLKDIADATAIKTGESLLELLCWLIVNGLYSRALNLNLYAHGNKLAPTDLAALAAQLQEFLSAGAKPTDDGLDAFQQHHQWQKSLLIVNLGEGQTPRYGNQPIVMSERSDPLSYGDNRQCFVQVIERVSVSTWGEITLGSYHGAEGFFDCVTEVFNNTEAPVRREAVQWLCQTPIRAKSIVQRCETVFASLVRYFAEPGADSIRYILPDEAGYAMFTHHDVTLSYWRIATTQQLLQELALGQPVFSPVRFDPFVLDNTLVPLIYQHNTADCLQIFYHTGAKHITVYILDERGALFTQQHQNAKAEQVLSSYNVFFGTLLDHAKLPGTPLVRHYEIHKNSAGVMSCHPQKADAGMVYTELAVRVAAETAPTGNEIYTIFCNEKVFSSAIAEELFKTVRQYIIGQRQSKETYPIYITEIDVPYRLLGVDHFSHLQSVHYLAYKQKIEARLNGF